MKMQTLIKGPGALNVRFALAQMILSCEGSPALLSFTVNEGTDTEPNHVERVFPIVGFRDFGSRNGPIYLYLPVAGEGAPEKETRLYFHPEAPEGHVGHVEIDDED